MSAAAAATAITLRIGRCRSSDHGHDLGLKTGDVLIGAGGKRWTGSLDSLKGLFAGAERPVALTFQRGESVWTVLTDRPDLAQWERIPAPQGAQLPAVPAELLCNWEILANADRMHDLFPQRASIIALVAPALWLAQQRLWTLLATLGAALAVALPAGVPVLIALWAAAGVHLWRSGADHLRADRAGGGFHRVGIVAARTEVEAIAVWEGLCPGARFRFEGAPASLGVSTAT
jgi:hypothetical protein